jgi:hypothetical protein
LNSQPRRLTKPTRKTHTDLGEWPQDHDATYQAIAGHYCPWHQERAYEHHLHYLADKNLEDHERIFDRQFRKKTDIDI